MVERNEALAAARAGMANLAARLETVQASVDRRDAWVRKWVPRLAACLFVVLLALAAAVAWLGQGYYENAAAIDKNEQDAAEAEQERIQRCIETRTQEVNQAHAIADGSAEGLRAAAQLMQGPDSTPEQQQRIDLFAQTYRDAYLADLLEATPDPDDCD